MTVLSEHRATKPAHGKMSDLFLVSMTALLQTGRWPHEIPKSLHIPGFFFFKECEHIMARLKF